MSVFETQVRTTFDTSSFKQYIAEVRAGLSELLSLASAGGMGAPEATAAIGRASAGITENLGAARGSGVNPAFVSRMANQVQRDMETTVQGFSSKFGAAFRPPDVPNFAQASKDYTTALTAALTAGGGGVKKVAEAGAKLHETAATGVAITESQNRQVEAQRQKTSAAEAAKTSGQGSRLAQENIAKQANRASIEAEKWQKAVVAAQLRDYQASPAGQIEMFAKRTSGADALAQSKDYAESYAQAKAAANRQAASENEALAKDKPYLASNARSATSDQNLAAAQNEVLAANQPYVASAVRLAASTNTLAAAIDVSKAASSKFSDSVVAASTAANNLQATLGEALTADRAYIDSTARLATMRLEQAGALAEALSRPDVVASRAFKLTSQNTQHAAENNALATDEPYLASTVTSRTSDNVVAAAQNAAAAASQEYAASVAEAGIQAQAVAAAEAQALASSAEYAQSFAAAAIAAKDQMVAEEGALLASREYTTSTARLAVIRAEQAAAEDKALTSPEAVRAQAGANVARQQRQDAEFAAENEARRAAGLPALVAPGAGVRPGTGPGNRGGFLGRLGQGLGVGSPGGFIGSIGESAGGALAFGATAGIGFGAVNQLRQGVKDAEQLQQQLAIMKTLLDGIGQGANMGTLTNQILDTARATGVGTNQVATLAQEFVGLRQNVGAALPDIQAGAELLRITGQNAATAGPQIAAIAEDLGGSARDVGNAVVSISEATGRSFTDSLNAVGGMSSVANELGLTLAQASGLVKGVAAETGKSGTAIGEAFSRTLPTITDNLPKLGGLGFQFDATAKAGSGQAIITELLTQMQTASPAVQQQAAKIIGGPRFAPVFAAAFVDPARTLAAFNSANDPAALAKANAAAQDTLKGRMDQLTASVSALVASLLNSGLLDALKVLLQMGGDVASIIGVLVRAFGSLNSATHGVLGDAILAFLAFNQLEKIGGIVTAVQVAFSKLGTTIKGVAAEQVALDAASAAQGPAAVAGAGGATAGVAAASGGEVVAGGLAGAGVGSLGRLFAGSTVLSRAPGLAGLEAGTGVSATAGFTGVGIATALIVTSQINSLKKQVAESQSSFQQQIAAASPETLITYLSTHPSEGLASRITAALTGSQTPNQQIGSEIITQEDALKGPNSQVIAGLIGGGQLKIPAQGSPFQAQFGSQKGPGLLQTIGKYAEGLSGGALIGHGGQTSDNATAGGAIESVLAAAGKNQTDQGDIKTLQGLANKGNPAAKKFLDALAGGFSPKEIEGAKAAKKHALDTAVVLAGGTTSDMDTAADTVAQAQAAYQQGTGSLGDVLKALQHEADVNAHFPAGTAAAKKNAQDLAQAAQLRQQAIQSAYTNEAAVLQYLKGYTQVQAQITTLTPEAKDLNLNAEQRSQAFLSLIAARQAQTDQALQLDKSITDDQKILDSVPGLTSDEVIQANADALATGKPPPFPEQEGKLLVWLAGVKKWDDYWAKWFAAYNAFLKAFPQNGPAAAGQAATGIVGPPPPNPGAMPDQAIKGTPSPDDLIQRAQNQAATDQAVGARNIAIDNLHHDSIAAADAGVAAAQKGVADAIAIVQASAAKAGITNPDLTDNPDVIAAQTAVITAQHQAYQARLDQVNAQIAYGQTLNKYNPVGAAQQLQKKAQLELGLLKESQAQVDAAVKNGTATAAEWQQATDKLAGDQAYGDAVEGLAQAKFNYAEALANQAGDPIGAANLKVNAAKQALNDAIARGFTGQPLIDAQSNYQNTITQAIQTQISTTESRIQAQLDLNQITRGQAIAKLQQLLAVAQNTDERQQILEQIKALKTSTQGDLQFNLPSDLNLPTLYQVRRLNQSPAGVGLADNRVINVNMNIYNGMDQQAAQAMLTSALGGSGPLYGTSPRFS